MNIDKIVQDWKEEIESINIDGFSRKVSNIDINKLIDNDWKVTFNFEQINKFDLFKMSGWSVVLRNSLKNYFQKFGKVTKSDFNEDLFLIYFGDNYILYQGYRFIIQFNIADFISNKRQETLDNLLDDVG
jgi:hypothetical protein